MNEPPMPSPPTDSGLPSEEAAGTNHPSTLRSIFWEIFGSIVVILIVITSKIAFEETAFGEGLDLASYATLQRFVSTSGQREGIPCQVISIDGIRPVPVNIGDQDVSVTPRHRLTPLIEAAIKAEPVAIGIDIDCSPWNGIPITPDDAETFSSWKKKAEDAHVRFYLAVQRGRASGPEHWLPDKTLQEVAAAIAASDEYIRYHTQWISAPGSEDRLIGMGPALAGKRDVIVDLPPNPLEKFWGSSIKVDERVGMRTISQIQCALTDYSFISELQKTVVINYVLLAVWFE